MLHSWLEFQQTGATWAEGFGKGLAAISSHGINFKLLLPLQDVTPDLLGELIKFPRRKPMKKKILLVKAEPPF